MARPQLPEPVKYFAAVLWNDAKVLHQALHVLENRLGKIDYNGPDHLFDVTDYYAEEMGSNLYRRLVSFAPMDLPDALVERKLLTNALEISIAENDRRRINVDIGYLDDNKVVLGSCKRAGQKIYLSDGIWADMIARFRDGKYRMFEWSFLDFRDGRYDDDLLEIRAIYLEQLRDWRKRRQGGGSEPTANSNRS